MAKWRKEVREEKTPPVFVKVKIRKSGFLTNNTATRVEFYTEGS